MFSNRKGIEIPEWSQKYKIDDFEYNRLKEFYKDKPELAKRDGWNGDGFNLTTPLIKSYSSTVNIGDIISVGGSKFKAAPQNIENLRFLSEGDKFRRLALSTSIKRESAKKSAPWIFRKLGLYSEREKVPADILEESWKSGVIQKDSKGQWRIISRQKGEYWSQIYSSKEKAENALRAYQASRN